jgi:hypothetical protein
MTVDNDTTTEPTASEPLAPLTDREIAILEGHDPDSPDTDAADAAHSDAGTDAENSGGTDAPENTDEPVAGKIEASWITPEVEAEAETYGFSKDDLIDLGDEDSYKRTKRVLDRTLYTTGQRSLQAPSPAPQPVAKDGAQGGKDPAPTGFQKFDLDKLRAEGYDDHVLSLSKQINELADQNAKYTKFIEQQEQAAQAAAHTAHLNEFNAAADALDAELFGKLGDKKFGKEHNANREKLYDAALTIVSGIAARAQAAGQEARIPPMSTLLQRARDYAFADQLKQRETKRRTAEIAKQSAQRRPVAGRSVKTTPTVSVEKDPIKRIANAPDLVEFFRNAQEENGVAA